MGNNRNDIIKRTLKGQVKEGLNLQKKKETPIVITKIIEVIDNWGNTETTKDPGAIEEILKDSDLWTDDMTLHTSTPEGKDGPYYFWDDLVGKLVSVTGGEPFIMTEKEAINEGLNLPKGGDLASGIENKLRFELEKSVGNVVGLSVTGDKEGIQVYCKMGTLVGPIVFGLDYRPGNGYEIRFNNEFKFTIKGTDKNQIINNAKGAAKKAKMISGIHEIIFDIIDRVFK